MQREHYRIGSFREGTKPRAHHIIGEITADGEFREVGTPLLPSTRAAEIYSDRLALWVTEQNNRNFESRELAIGDRYLRRYVRSDRQIMYKPVFHGINDGKHGSVDSTSSIDTGEQYSRETQID